MKELEKYDFYVPPATEWDQSAWAEHIKEEMECCHGFYEEQFERMEEERQDLKTLIRKLETLRDLPCVDCGYRAGHAGGCDIAKATNFD